MSTWETATTRASIVGLVADGTTKLPLRWAQVDILAGPPAFEQLRALRRKDPAWWYLPERMDRTRTRKDGSYCFINLPVGAYRILVSMRASAYKPVEVTVDTSEVQDKAIPWTNVELVSGTG
jgi:hypothetical protein